MELLAGVSALLAIPALVLALVFGVLFFLGRGRHYGPLNDVASAAVMFLLVLPAIAVRDTIGDDPTWFGVVTWIAVAGMIFAGISQLLLVIGMITLNVSFIAGGIGFVPVVAWLTGLSWLSIEGGAPQAAVGWTMAIGLVFVAAIVVLFRTPLNVRLGLATAGTVAIATSLLLLGVDLIST